MNDRLFRQHIAFLVEREHREAEAEAHAQPEVQKKPPGIGQGE